MVKTFLKSFGFFLDFLDDIIDGIDFHFILLFDVFHDIGLNMNTVDLFLDLVFVDSKGSQFIEVETEQ